MNCIETGKKKGPEHRRALGSLFCENLMPVQLPARYAFLLLPYVPEPYPAT